MHGTTVKTVQRVSGILMPTIRSL